MPDTGIRLYNTLTRTKEEFSPIDPSDVRIYVCGPTVYDFAHIGNARPAIVFDVLFRLLRHIYGERHVTYVRNITDVDDKINARALKRFGKEVEAGKMTLNEAIREVTEGTANRYREDVATLGCLEPTREPRATEHIDGMVEMIRSLIDKGHAYVAAGDEGREVLFDVRSMPDYGRLSNRRPEDQQAGARVGVKDHKKNPGDFVLWKESSATEPGWDASFAFDGRRVAIHGRPGWHIECSAMSKAYLGEVFDIHGGGLDLIFPHHENEIAQSRCALGSAAMANVWMHNGFLRVEGRKMSKSEGNFVVIRENLRGKFPGWSEGPWHGLVLRAAMLMTPYAQPIDWKLERLLEARSIMSKWYLALSNWADDEWIEFQKSRFRSLISEPYVEVLEFLSDDLATQDAINFLSRYFDRSHPEKEISKLASSMKLLGLLDENALSAYPVVFSEKIAGDKQMKVFMSANDYGVALANKDSSLSNEISERLSRLGWQIKGVKKNYIDLEPTDGQGADIQSIIDRRSAFIAEKNWAEADRIRDDLLARGIRLKDSKDPETGERVTKWR